MKHFELMCTWSE